jgi:hypothetical protein
LGLIKDISCIRQIFAIKAGRTLGWYIDSQCYSCRFKTETFDFFRNRSVKNRRLDDDVLTDTNEVLLNNLKLTDNGYLKRAALLLSPPDPERFVSGAYIKIEIFRIDSDLLFQDENADLARAKPNLFEF